MESRLDLLCPHLVKKLIQADEETLRKIASAVTQFALSHYDLNEPWINQVASSLRDTPPSNSLFIRQKLLGFVEQLDEVQWNLRDQVEQGTGQADEYLKTFGRARAVHALYYALDSHPYIAAAESVYEAHAATNDFKALEELINHILAE
jgi:hypothetical protein